MKGQAQTASGEQKDDQISKKETQVNQAQGLDVSASTFRPSRGRGNRGGQRGDGKRGGGRDLQPYVDKDQQIEQGQPKTRQDEANANPGRKENQERNQGTDSSIWNPRGQRGGRNRGRGQRGGGAEPLNSGAQHQQKADGQQRQYQ